MEASPRIGGQTPLRLPTQLPPVLNYHSGKAAVPNNIEVPRSHPPLKAGDFNKRKDAYYWESLSRNNHEDEILRLALRYGDERGPRCDLCEREDRACVSLPGKSVKTAGCACCIRRHLSCSQANSSLKSASDVQKSMDQSVCERTSLQTEKMLTVCQSRPSHSSLKRTLDEMDDREATEPPAKRITASMNGRVFELLEPRSSPHDDGDEYHMRVMSTGESIFMLPASIPGCQDSCRGSSVHKAEGDQMTRDEQQPDVDGIGDFGHANGGMVRNEQSYSATHHALEYQNPTDDQPTRVRPLSPAAASEIFAHTSPTTRKLFLISSRLMQHSQSGLINWNLYAVLGKICHPK
jgi:hypothetical protein